MGCGKTGDEVGSAIYEGNFLSDFFHKLKLVTVRLGSPFLSKIR